MLSSGVFFGVGCVVGIFFELGEFIIFFRRGFIVLDVEVVCRGKAICLRF